MIINTIIIIIFFPAVILLLGGNWRWIEGWIFGIWMDVMVAANMLYLYFKDPALLAERQKSIGSDNQKASDKYLGIAIGLLAVLWFIIVPLDSERFRWSPAFPVWLKILGFVILIPAVYLIQRTTMENTFMSTLIRVQDERKQNVVSTGLYSFVRHPLYLGTLLMSFGADLLLGSLAGLILNLITIILLVYRILGEEKMLAEELEGYEEYKKKVAYRLIPFIW